MRDFHTDAALRPHPNCAGPDNWPTRACLVTALISEVLPNLPAGPIWEPAAGAGGIVAALRAAGRAVIATDAWSDDVATRRDFLIDAPPDDGCMILSNPPFH
jgi:hypothetical protein